jgi:hypothetical protein
MDHRHLYRIKWFSVLLRAWYLECECGESSCYLDEHRWRFVENDLEMLFS